jgi:hypothetical protein
LIELTDIAPNNEKTLNTGMVTLNGVSVIDPSVLEWNLQDISASDAGRDEAMVMHKMKIGQTRTYKLEWNNIDPGNASVILRAINEKETFYCSLFDVMDGKMENRLYYVGDRTAPFRRWTDQSDGKVYSKISFTLIEVTPDSNKDEEEEST